MGSEPRSSREVMTAIRALGDKGSAVEGVHVHMCNRPPVEYHWVADIRRDIFSASKTFTSVAVAIAQGEGLLDVDDSILSHLGHLTSAAATGVEAITIRHLLTMTSGMTYRWDDPDADHPGDAAVDILTTPLGTAPGTVFAYRGANTYQLSRIIHACSGQDLRDFLLPRLFTPLGIRNPQWLRCPLGYSLGAVGLYLRTAEIARLGCKLLENGRFLDQQLVPATFVTSMTADCVPTNGHIATGATCGPPGERAIRPPRLDVPAGRRLANGRPLGAIQRHAASPTGLRDDHCPLPRANRRHSGRHLVGHRARAQLTGTWGRGPPQAIYRGYRPSTPVRGYVGSESSPQRAGPLEPRPGGRDGSFGTPSRWILQGPRPGVIKVRKLGARSAGGVSRNPLFLSRLTGQSPARL